MITHLYILEGHVPVHEPDVLKWALWFEKSEQSRMVKNSVMCSHPVFCVKTMFRAIDLTLGLVIPPPLFETTIYCGDLDKSMDNHIERHTTWEDAEAYNQKMWYELWAKHDKWEWK